MAIGKNKILTPFHTKEGKLKFPYRALFDKVFIWPTPPPKKIGKRSLLDIPEQFRKRHQDGTGILLSVGPGYWGKKGKWHKTPEELKPGLRVAFDKSVPWGQSVKGEDGKNYRVVVCGVADILGVIEE